MILLCWFVICLIMAVLRFLDFIFKGDDLTPKNLWFVWVMLTITFLWRIYENLPGMHSLGQ